MLFPVKSGKFFSFVCAAYNNVMISDIVDIKGMHGLAGLQHHKVGNVYDVVDRTHTGST